MSKFSVKQTQAGFSFNLVADNGQVVATSQVYASKDTCLKGIESVQANAPLAPVEDQTVMDFETEECPKFEVYNDKAGKFRFRLKAGNGEIIAVSQAYKAKSSCANGIDSVRVNAVTADIVEEELSAVNAAPDYSKAECWYQIPEITKDVDTFYIFATDYILSSFDEGASDYAALDNPEMLFGAKIEYRDHASAYADSTNVFVPYYRQSGLRYAGEVIKKTGNFDNALLGLPYEDITAALDYYFENRNGGRPFIMAGHSQGSAMVLLLLRTYFKDHPEYYKRMVAAYTIGYSVTDEYLAANPHLKFATGETDTGVIIAYNTEGPGNVETNAHNIVVLPHTRSINPLNWKLDETYAPASMNLGSIIEDKKTGETSIGDVGADAQINLARGVVVTNAKVEPMPEDVAKVAAEFFGPDGRHGEDYMFYYNNIKANVAKRVAAYLAGK